MISIEEAVKLLSEDGIVAIPTETVYGLGAIATSQKAITKVYKAKNRPEDNPLICHFYDIEQIREYVPKIHEYVEVLIDEFTPGPISFLLDLPSDSPLKAATSGMDSIICRIPQHDTTLELLEELNRPIAAPSANTSGKISGTSPEMVEKDLGSKIDGIVDGGECLIGLESTIIDCRKAESIKILRPGYIGKEELKEVFEEHGLKIKVSSPTKIKKKKKKQSPRIKLTTPGEKHTHYAPDKPVYLSENWRTIAWSKEKFAVLATDEIIEEINEEMYLTGRAIHLIKLGSRKRIDLIAKNLYKNLSKTNDMDIDRSYLINESWEKSSLAEAIENRLEKATK